MKTKRLVLMLLVMLMSVTGAWASVSQTEYTTLQTDFTQSNHGSKTDMYDYTCNSNQATMVIQTNSPIILGKIEVYVWDWWSETSPNSIKIEGSNDQSEWVTLTDQSLITASVTQKSVSVSSPQSFQYFRLTFYGASGSSIVLRNIYIYKSFFDGSGTSQDPYILDNISYLKQYAEFVAGGNNTACAKLTTDFDLNDIDWSPIDNVNFKGIIDGNGHSIKNLKSANGLFKSIGAATIKNLTIENATLSATDEYSGVLAAQAIGTTFQKCFVKGTISASSANVGGLVGNAYGATFTQCCSVGDFSVGNANCGGLVGMASGNTQLTQCYISVPYIDEIRPTFVSTTTPDSYNNSNPASNLVDADGTDTRWCAKKDHKVGGVWNIVVTTGVAIQLKSIRLWNADNQTYPKRRWKSLKVYGSASSDGEWAELKSDENLNLAINSKGLAGDIEVNATQKYTYYKIDVLDNEGDDYMQMSDMKFVVTSQQLPLCGSTDGSCTANLCYHYGNTSSALSAPVEKTDVTSGRLAYLLNNANIPGPYFQRIGSDSYPHFSQTANNIVYLGIDDASYTNTCCHKEYCTIYPFKVPGCISTLGNVEYGKCNNSLCGKYFLPSDRNYVTTNCKIFALSSEAVNIQDNYGKWVYSIGKNIGTTKCYRVMDLSVRCSRRFGGDYTMSYTVLDDDPTMNLHLYFDGANMTEGTFSVRFYVNDTERHALTKNYTWRDQKHDIVTIDGLHKYDLITVVFNYAYEDSGDDEEFAVFTIGAEKPGPSSHDLHKHELSYDCIDGGYQEHYECSRCTNVFTQNTPLSDKDITTLSNLAIAPVGAHNFGAANPDKQKEGNLYGVQCQNEHCTTFDPDHYVLRNYHNDTDLPLLYDGNTYTAKAPVSLTDAKEYVTPVEFSAADIEYTRTFYTNVWNPWFVPFTATVEELADNGVTDVATIESIHNYDTDDDGVVDKTVLEVIKKKNGTVKAGVPYMVRTGDNYTYPMEFSDRVMDASTNIKTLHSETISAAYDFMGTYSGLIAADLASSNHYSLNEEGKMVHRTLNILPQRWYMKEVGKENVYEELSPAMSRAFAIRVIGEEDETTGIRTIYPEDGQKEERLPEGIFDLNGRKLSAPHSGQINIINGKKHFVR